MAWDEIYLALSLFTVAVCYQRVWHAAIMLWWFVGMNAIYQFNVIEPATVLIAVTVVACTALLPLTRLSLLIIVSALCLIPATFLMTDPYLFKTLRGGLFAVCEAVCLWNGFSQFWRSQSGSAG